MTRINRLFSLALVLTTLAIAQTTTSTVLGTILDSSGSAVVGADCTLSDDASGRVMTANSWTDGSFTFQSVPAGKYSLKVRATGFKTLTVSSIPINASETRALGNIVLQVGEVRESVDVTAELAAVQTASSERSGLVTGSQLNDIALKGRDFFSLLQTIPGVVDTSQSREATANNSNMGIFINGSRDNSKEFAVDGMVTHDTHSNQSMPFMPNMDAIAEVKILTSNYQAEYGRNSGGSVMVVTKSGTRDFHGSGYTYYRHESLNANSFFNNRSNTAKNPYRYRISGYSIGGPVYIPKVFNTNRDKLFFFASQEFTGVKRDYGTQFAYTPTALERQGDFSQSRDVSGNLIPIKDPTTGLPFAGNKIPVDRLNERGINILNFYPLPNYVDPDPNNLYRRNYRSAFSGETPRRNDIARIDYNINESNRIYYRYARDKDPKDVPWADWKAGAFNYLLTPVNVDQKGYGNLFNYTRSISATSVNEFIFGVTRISRYFDYKDPSLIARSNMGNLPQWYADPESPDYIPNVVFGGQPASPIYAGLTAQVPNDYKNTVIVLTDQFSKIMGRHSLKFGFTAERTQSDAPTGNNFRGTMSFARDANNPLDSGHSFSNALLGVLTSYSEASRRNLTQQQFWSFEWYAQDNWRITNRLALDVGMRFYAVPPIKELSQLAATFDPSLYSLSDAPTLYRPALNASGRRVAQDPISGAFAPAPMIGLFVPGSGSYTNGMAVGGKDGYPVGLYKRPAVVYGPRIGFAYDMFGNGRTALRGGWGWFHDTSQSNPFSNTTGNPPISFTPTLYYGSLDTYAETAGAVGPTSMTALYGRHRSPNTMNFSMSLQHRVWNTLIDASYVGSLSRHLFLLRNTNPIPMFSRYDTANLDPTRPGTPLLDNFFRPYQGYGDLNTYENSGTSNYNAFQLSANRRYTSGFQFGLAYTWSKTLGVADTDTSGISPYFSARSRNYGPLGYDRAHVLTFNYMYDVPGLGAKLGSKPLGWITDRWQLSGLTSFSTGAPITPNFSTTDPIDLTGSSEGARITVVGNPIIPDSEKSFNNNFNESAFIRTPKGSFGNAGVGILRGPGFQNWDISITKRVPLWSEQRYVQFRTELFNAWNHTQFSSYSATFRFDATGRQTDPNLGSFTAARSPRIIQLSLRVVF